jgi:hypothetical protein
MWAWLDEPVTLPRIWAYSGIAAIVINFIGMTPVVLTWVFRMAGWIA